MWNKKPEQFGRNLGLGIKPWVQRFGVDGQMNLAKAILNPHRPEYKGLNIPTSHTMISAAQGFIAHNAALSEGFRNVGHQAISKYKLELTFSYITHHSIIEKAYNDPLRYKALYGNQKVIDPKSRKIIQDYKEAIRFARNRTEKKELKDKLRDFERRTTRMKWEVEAERFSVIPKRDPSQASEILREGKSYIKQHNINRLMEQDVKLRVSQENFWEKEMGGEDPGEYIGKGNELEHIKSDLIRLVEYLKKARWVKRSVYDGIMKPKNTYVRAFLRQHLGTRKFREFFLSYNAVNKYSTNAYFRPGSEYGRMRSSYDNQKGQLSPLQRRRTFDRAGKEIIKDEK